MAMLRGLLGGAAGAAAYNVYQEGGSFSAKDMASGLFDAFQRKGATQMADMSRMHRQVEDLQSALLKTLHDRGTPTVIVTDSNRGSGKVIVVVAAAAGGALLYCRFVKGWKLSDMMYVTQGALASMQESVNTGLATVRTQLDAATSDLVARLGAVASKAEAMLGRQDALDDKLDDVAGRVDEVNDGVAVLQQQVAYTNNAVTLLCGALAEVAKRVGLGNGRYVRAVDGLVHGAPPGLVGPQQQLVLADGGAIPLLTGPDGGVILLDPASAGPGAAPGGFGLPAEGVPRRVNPAVYSIAGGGGGCAAAAVAAAATSAPGSAYAAPRGPSATIVESISPPHAPPQRRVAPQAQAQPAQAATTSAMQPMQAVPAATGAAPAQRSTWTSTLSGYLGGGGSGAGQRPKKQ